MKKLLSIIVAMVIAASFFTGCVGPADSEVNSDIQPTPAVTPAPTPETDEEDPNYPTVLAMWSDMDGYWVNRDGDYLYFTLDENGKAVMYEYDDDGKLESFMKATAVMSSNKTSYYMALDLPRIKAGEGPAADFAQTASAKGFMIELAGYGDGYVEIAEEGDEIDYDIYVKVGSNLDKLADAVKQAKKLDK